MGTGRGESEWSQQDLQHTSDLIVMNEWTIVSHYRRKGSVVLNRIKESEAFLLLTLTLIFILSSDLFVPDLWEFSMPLRTRIGSGRRRQTHTGRCLKVPYAYKYNTH